MRRGTRVAVTVAALAGSVGVVLALAFAGSASEGPLSATLRRAGGLVAELEATIVRRVRGPGRAERLAWLDPLRRDAGALRSPDRVLIGAYDDGLPRTLEGVVAVEDALGTTFPLVQVYTAWGDGSEHRFPTRLVEAIWELGSIPVITWEPWLTTFENRLHPELPLRGERDRGGLAAIADGRYDFYVDAWAREAAAFDRPILLRFAHEMNDPYRYPWGPQNNHPFDFIAAWRHVVERFRAAGADDVLWVWSPHVAYEGYGWFYPGGAWVDWIATGALNYGSVATWSRWWSFDEIFGRHHADVAAYGKPVMIAEFGSLAVGGDRAAWYRRALADLPDRYPAVRALLFFHDADDATVTYQALDWSFASDSLLARTIARGLETWEAGPATP